MQQMNVSSPMNNTELNLKTLFKKRKRKETYFQTTFSKQPIRFEFEVLSCAMIPMLSCVDKIRLQRVSKGFYACVARQLEWHKLTPQKEFEGYWYFLERHFKRTNLLQDFLLSRFKKLLREGLHKNNFKKYSYSEESMSVFIYYLCTKNRRYLHRLLHTMVPHLDEVTRRCFRRLWLRTERHLLRQKQLPIKPSRVLRTKMSKVVSNTILSASNETGSLELTQANLQQHNKRKASSRHVQSPKRYKPEVVNLKDDLSASEVGSEDVPIEERSVDSQSEGSLKDFIVDDDESLHEKTEEEEDELSDRETEDSASFHSSVLTDSDE